MALKVNTKPTEEQAENLKKAAKEPKTEDGFIKANTVDVGTSNWTTTGNAGGVVNTQCDGSGCI